MENQIKTISGSEAIDQSYTIWHVWGAKTSCYYAAKSIKSVSKKHPKLYINVASIGLKTQYPVLD